MYYSRNGVEGSVSIQNATSREDNPYLAMHEQHIKLYKLWVRDNVGK